jgi:hypothetical protein
MPMAIGQRANCPWQPTLTSRYDVPAFLGGRAAICSTKALVRRRVIAWFHLFALLVRRSRSAAAMRVFQIAGTMDGANAGELNGKCVDGAKRSGEAGQGRMLPVSALPAALWVSYGSRRCYTVRLCLCHREVWREWYRTQGCEQHSSRDVPPPGHTGIRCIADPSSHHILDLCKVCLASAQARTRGLERHAVSPPIDRSKA